MSGTDRVAKRWRVWNINYREAGKGMRRLVRTADLGLPWIAHNTDHSRVFATHAEALEYTHQQTRKSAA